MRQMAAVRTTSKMLVIVVLLSLVAPRTEASWLGFGCWVCDYVGLTGVEERCDMVGNGENGDGTNCNESNDLTWGWFCYTNNTPCYNTIVTGGGGGGAGGGGSACSRAPGAPCPAECSSCVTDPYAN
jgi:hypothetical protein